MAKSREWSKDYLQKQIKAMRWLAYQGLTAYEIREMSWGAVDESKRTLRLRKTLFSVRYDLSTKQIYKVQHDKFVETEVDDPECADFFFKSKIYCAFIFTAHRPKTWRKQGSRESLFPVEVVENFCQKELIKDSASALTKLGSFATIELSKLNITKMKTEWAEGS